VGIQDEKVRSQWDRERAIELIHPVAFFAGMKASSGTYQAKTNFNDLPNLSIKSTYHKQSNNHTMPPRAKITSYM
jgi:hypothetical protein